jgi:hypothetical protein
MLVHGVVAVAAECWFVGWWQWQQNVGSWGGDGDDGCHGSDLRAMVKLCAAVYLTYSFPA